MITSTADKRKLRMALSIIAVIVVACKADVAPERIAGTETVGYNGGRDIITVSPSGRWLTFMEKGANDGSAKDLRASSIDLNTGEKMVHSVRNLRESGMSPRSGSTIWSHVASSFEAECWSGDSLYLDMFERGGVKDIVIVPSSPEAAVAQLPAERTCSDCAPAGVVVAIAKSRDIWGYERKGLYSIAYRDGELSSVMYFVKPDRRRALVWRIDENGKMEPVYQSRRILKNLRAQATRVSPDERYLAYVVESKLRAPIPLPDAIDALYVRNLETQEECKVGEYRIVGNLIWSADSRRLYYPGFGEHPDDQSVYVMDVSRLFDETD